MGSFRICMCFTRNFITTEAETPEDIEELFNKYTLGGCHMNADQLHKFLVQVQGESEASVSDAERIVDQVLRIRHPIAKFTRNYLTLDDFHHFLFSSTLNPPIGNQVHQDMTAPLSHYYIYTGHNSYLTGNQISSACSDVPIIKALQRGVRGVELDLWPNSTKDDVLVLHGWTLTTPVKLIRCLKSIKEFAFSTSPYPVIITLEDHLPPHLQSRVAEMITQTFGEMLWYPETEFLKEFPSPEELKYRIIISTKLPKEYLQSKILNTIANESQKEKDSENDEWGNEPTELIANKENDNKSNSGCGDQSPDDEVNDDSTSESGPPESPEYKLLIAIEVKKRKGGLKKALKLDIDKVRRLSLREQTLKKAAESYSADVVRFTQKNFLRIFPKATRVTSSNYRPLIGWRLGAQMVALNMQGYGRPLWLMHGMFRANGGCGYVKKPNFLMNIGPHGDVFDPNAIYPVKTTLKFSFIQNFLETLISSFAIMSTTSEDLRSYNVDEQSLFHLDVETQKVIISPGGSMYWRPSCNDECKPYLNQLFTSLEEGILFYKEYARKCGFDVRRNTEKKSCDGTVVLKHIICSRAGQYSVSRLDSNVDELDGESKKRRRTMSNKCGCRAKIILKYMGTKGYIVLKFVEEHSHTLGEKDQRQFLKRSRVLGLSHKKLIFDAVNANVSISRSFNLMKEMCGGYSNVGSTLTEFHNFSRDIKLFIGSRDAQMIVQKLKDKKEMCDGFFYDFDVDEDGHLTKLFWSDIVARRFYDVFGDVVSFDATFRTNKYNMVFVPFTGVDNHKKCVTYGVGLLSKEDTEHYVWVFEAFLRCMNREPVCIITDQCPAMKRAIPMAFKNTRHRLCMWHIMKKFPTKVKDFIDL